ncbi:MAG: GILT family protein [Nanoarchaeota archaeon]|nr:GILT family protein [Nanoarchaeota archaeon]
MAKKLSRKEKIHMRLKRRYSWKLLSIVLFTLLIASMFTGGFGDFFKPTAKGLDATAEETLSYINDNILQGQSIATLESVEETDFLYKMTLGISGQEFDSYVSKDGKILCPTAVDLTETPETVTPNTQSPAVTGAAICDNTPKAAKPKVALYYMSYCPYGVQAIQGIAPAIKLLGDSVDFEPHYVIYSNYRGGGPDYCIDDGQLCSMHGIAELNEDIRQACVWKYQNDKFWDYTLCTMDECNLGDIETCWKTCAEKNGVDIDATTTCQTDEGVTLMRAEKALNEKNSVSGSPMIFINDAKYSGGRAAESFKQGICCGFETEPEECDTTLGAATQAATGNC